MIKFQKYYINIFKNIYKQPHRYNYLNHAVDQIIKLINNGK